MILTQEIIDKLIEEYASEILYDYWDITAKIINDNFPREMFYNDSEFYYNVYCIWGMVKNYSVRDVLKHERAT